MKNKLELFKKLFIHHSNYFLFLFFLFLGILLTLYVEYKFQYAQFKWLGRRTLIILLAVFEYGSLPKKLRRFFRPIIFIALIFFILLFLLNFLANYINVYHLDRYQYLTDFCLKHNQVCLLAGKSFYKFKIYRFVSLTVYFFLYIIFLLIGLLFSQPIYNLVNKIWQNNFTGKTPKIKLKYIWLFYFLLAYLFIQQLLPVFALMSEKTVKIITTLNVPFEKRWELAMGGRFSFGWIDTYIKFVNAQVPENALILIPNRVSPWSMEGNPEYIRWFLYPRRNVQMLDADEIPNGVDYILLTSGVFDINKNVFPNFFIEKEKIAKIILVDQETLAKQEIFNEDFIPENYQNKWGVIKLK